MGIKTRRGIEFGHGTEIYYDRGSGELKIRKGATELAGVASTETIAAGVQASNIADPDNEIAVTYTTGDPSITPDGAITIADGATPTVSELLEFCEELNAAVAALDAKLASVISAIEAFDISASS